MAYHRFHFVAFAALTLAACNMPNPAFGLDTDTEAGSGGSGVGTRGSSAGGTSSGATSGTSGTGTGTSSTGNSGGATATSGTSAGATGPVGSTGAVDTGGTGMGSTGGIPLCPLPTPAGGLDVLFAEGGQNPMPAPGQVNIQGVLTEYVGGKWKLGYCKGFDPCSESCVNPDTFNAFVFTELPPGGWDPPVDMGQCFSAVMHWNDDGTFQGGAIWGMEVGGLLSQNPLWVGRGVGTQPASFDQLGFTVDPKPVDSCECEQMGCCAYDPPGTYNLKVSGSLVLDGGLTLMTGETRTGTIYQTPVKMIDVVSVVENSCDAAHEQFTWIVKEDG